MTDAQKKKRASYGSRWTERIKAARLQNETAPETLLIWHEKRFEKREKGPEKRSETRSKHFYPSQAD